MTKTDTRHTPAPWLPGIKEGDVEPVVAGGVLIAKMIPTDCTEEEFQANCALVYAAPNMLAALEVARDELACYQAGNAHDEATNAALATVRAAIDKAKGQIHTNCLAGMQCPECKGTGPFKISAIALFTVHDDGADEFGDIEYDDGSYCECPQCGFDGIVDDFKKGDPS